MRAVTGIALVASLVACSGEESDVAQFDSNAEESAASEPSDTNVATQDMAEDRDLPSEKSSGVAPICAASETTIFSCKMENGKTLSVCASDNVAEYRYGRDVAELTLTGGQWASVPYSGGGEAQLAFDNADTRYVVYSRVVRTNFKEGEPNNPAITDGVIIIRGGQTIGEQSCGSGELMPIQVFEAEKFLRKADDLFTLETDRAGSDKTS